MASPIEQLAQRAHTTEQKLVKLADGGAPSGELTVPLETFRVACEDVIFADFEDACAKGTEVQLWNAHLKVNGVFRKEFRTLRRAPSHVVESRKLAKHYLQFIKASQRFYRQFILRLDTQCDGICELRKLAATWKDDASKTAPRKRFPAALKDRVLLSCHQTLIQLGDLSRYRETELKEKDRNWGPATGYYALALEIYPDSGQSHNQLAVISREDGNHFRSTYHLYRSLGTKYPHPHARPNLELEFKKIIQAWKKGGLIQNYISSDGNTAGRALVAWFIRLHSKCYKGEEFVEHDELENEVLTQLAVELKERPLDSVLHKIIIINLAAEYFSTIQMQASTPPENIMRTYFYYLRLNVKTFFTLLQIFQPELERLSEGEDVTRQNGDHETHLSDKITAVARRILPGLRLYSAWFARYWHVLNANVADTLTTVEVQELWKAYAGTLTLLASSFPVDQLPQDNYMLEEDTDTIGFQPLISQETTKLWYKDDGTMKEKWTDLERNHPNIEMLMRVRDLLIDGLHLTQNAEAPLDLDGLRFIYREAGLPSELLASPNNRPDGSPVIPARGMDFPLFPTQAPIADDQQSYSVAAPSDTASTVLAKDPAMNRMVDDLVGPDDGLDPLPEEDENIPPTPPEQTFEDTAMVDDTTFGVAPLTINDLVNSYYKKPMASPASPLFATPMNRVSSSSSMRLAVNLPSVPDGQTSGASIWNRNYNGTPGPSSPLIGNVNGARESPLNGMRPSGTPGHSRGDSTNSLRSSDWAVPTATPVQRPISGIGVSGGGLGSGASWGNPGAASYYGSIYGNNTNGNGFNGNDLNLMSPLMFGQGSSWHDKGQSSYGRTPPNGQGG
ncbi:hypothetical protein P154DRAFT_252341 [Amniculicola lignicola CBS 123094]|uniref:DNA/RNA-binding domain-containing protein n=1 Tax=Amniculicola lignicola CBS 123094 TaxID=1392246 RepID=A0A6A5W9S1_9PLEO|nr:hypothetical protein P154DRAFT_252341 [Amniculicola lignicola CBS 123094]